MKNRNIKIIAAAFSILLVCASAPASANVGLPMIFPVMHTMFFALIPVIAIEAVILKYSLQLSLKDALNTAAISNCFSTFLGIPLTWLVLLIISANTVGGYAYGLDTCFHKVIAAVAQAPWLVPYEEARQWIFPVANLVLLPFFFIASWATEYFVTKRMHGLRNPAVVNISCLKANAVTYLLLLVYAASKLDLSDFAKLKPL